MYASQTKRLCVRGAPSNDTRVQHHSMSEAETDTVIQPNIISSPIENQAASGLKMIASVSSAADPSRPNIITNDREADLNGTIAQNSTSRTSSNNCMDGFFANFPQLLNQVNARGPEGRNIEILLVIRNQVTASIKRKDLLINHPQFSKLVQLMKNELSSPDLKCHIALLFCSLAKSGEHVAEKLISCSMDIELYKCLSSSHEPLVEASLRCLRSILFWPSSVKSWLFYQDVDKKNESTYSHKDKEVQITLEQMLSFTSGSRSIHARECVADILSYTCVSEREQKQLFEANALGVIYKLMESISTRVVLTSVNWLTQMCIDNSTISKEVAKHESGRVLDRLRFLMHKDKCLQMQFLAARCYTNIFRAIGDRKYQNEQYISRDVLPTLVSMVKEDKPIRLRRESAECIAYLIEADRKLQETASNCDHLVESLVRMLDYDNLDTLESKNPSNGNAISDDQDSKFFWLNVRTQRIPTLGVNAQFLQDDLPLSLTHCSEQSDLYQGITQAAFLALAALGSSEEPIRKKIFSNPSVMQHLVKSLTEPDRKTLKSALTCLLSLSRSVQQLRTTFVESSVYKALRNLLNTTSDDILILVLAILCNVSVEFSPGKQQFLDTETIEKLCSLTHRTDPALRLHGMWILMNIVYQDRNQNLKFQIVNTLGMNHVIDLIDNETNEDIVLKTLGFLRNVLSQKGDIDAVMKSFGDQIMQSLIRVIESQNRNFEVREQALCVLTNIADGSESKRLLMSSRILGYMAKTIGDESTGDLRLAAICCITNLIHKKNEGSFERRSELKKYGIDEKLRSLLSAPDPALSDRARTAYNQFINGLEDK